jgi:hypothetical protein
MGLRFVILPAIAWMVRILVPLPNVMSGLNCVADLTVRNVWIVVNVVVVVVLVAFVPS